MLIVKARVVFGVPFDQLPSILKPPTFKFDFVLVPVSGFKLTESIVNRAVFVGVNVRAAEEVATNLSVYVPFADTVVPVNPPSVGVTLPAVQFEIVYVRRYSLCR